jgi:Fe-S cluster assembly protein SufD
MTILLESSLIPEALKSLRPKGWAALRESAGKRLGNQSWPTLKDEAWKYCDLSLLETLDLKLAESFHPSFQDRIVPEADQSRAVFINGIYAPEHSQLRPSLDGFSVKALATSDAQELGSMMAPEEDDLFSNLNSARFQDGIEIRVAKNVRVDKPLHVLFLNKQTQTDAALILPRVLIVLEAGAELELIEEHAGEGVYLSAPVVEILVGEGACLRHERVQQESLEAFHVGNLRCIVKRDGKYLSRTISFGGRISRQNPHVELDGEGAEASLDGLALLDGQQVADTHSLLIHLRPHGTTRQLHKCIADGQSRGIFNGRIWVAKDAQVTDAQQQSRNLLLSDQARIDTKPQLEIYADDVKCAHGAAIGQLDPEELFYLQSRGLNAQAARNLLTYGFASDLIGRIEVTSLRRRLRQTVMARTNASDLEALG